MESLGLTLAKLYQFCFNFILVEVLALPEMKIITNVFSGQCQIDLGVKVLIVEGVHTFSFHLFNEVNLTLR